uniref:Uncharacterized protein n=1 Tax=Rhipicephalus zambeziensis TaxID=60191 RepID=A0A224YAP6_9ACAR
MLELLNNAARPEGNATRVVSSPLAGCDCLRGQVGTRTHWHAEHSRVAEIFLLWKDAMSEDDVRGKVATWQCVIASTKLPFSYSKRAVWDGRVETTL